MSDVGDMPFDNESSCNLNIKVKIAINQGIWSGTPWSGAIQNSGLFWIGVRSFHSNPECNPECNPKLRPILDLECGLLIYSIVESEGRGEIA